MGSIGLVKEYGIHRIQCGLPIPAATINVYFTKDPVPTIIDAPPEGSQYLDELDHGLRSLGSSLGEIRRIIITHPHFDHYGSAGSIGNRTGAEIWAFGEGAHWIEHYEEELDREDRHRRALLSKCGVPAGDVDHVNEYYRKANSFGRGAVISRRLSEGDRFELGHTVFIVSHVPGHTPFCIMLRDTENRLAFTGDFLPPHAPGSPLVQWTDLRSQEYRTTASYVASLRKVRAMNLGLALPGHGPAVTNPTARIEALLDLIQERRSAILKVLEAGPATPYLVACQLFPLSSRESIFRTVSDVIGHLEMLEEESFVMRGDGDVLFFARTN